MFSPLMLLKRQTPGIAESQQGSGLKRSEKQRGFSLKLA
jgi:hypothetical protein